VDVRSRLAEGTEVGWDRFPCGLDSIIPLLQEVQRETGYVSEEGLARVAEHTRAPMSAVYGVATFYNFFRLDPVGEHTVTVCLGTACYVKGGQEILKRLKRELGVEEGRTTEDGLFTLDTARCFGACGLAPVIMVDAETYGRLSPTKALSVVERYRAAATAREENEGKDGMNEA